MVLNLGCTLESPAELLISPMPNTKYSGSSNSSYIEHSERGRVFYFFLLVTSVVNDEVVFDKLSLKCLWEMQTEMSHLIRQMQKPVTIT